MAFSEALRIESSMADHFCVLPEYDVLENEADNDFAYKEYLEAEDEDWNGDSCWGCRVDLADKSQQLRFSYIVPFKFSPWTLTSMRNVNFVILHFSVD